VSLSSWGEPHIISLTRGTIKQEAPMGGWIKLHRDITDHWIFNFDEPDKGLAWIYILSKANHKPNKFKIKNTLIEVDRGQLAMSQSTLQKQFKWSQNKLKRFLKLLKNERMISFETNALTTIITICNYNDYQVIDNSDERPDERTNERPGERSANDQANDKQECKNEKNDKNKDIKEKNEVAYQDGINVQAWNEFEQHRKQIKKPLSNLARTKAMNLIKGFTQEEQQVCIDNSIQSRWAGLFPNKIPKPKEPDFDGFSHVNTMTLEESERSW
jgi:DNA replication protein DnaD